MFLKRTKVITWQAHDRITGPHHPDWYWTVGVIAVAIAILAAFFGNILLAIIILLSAFTASIAAHHGPSVVSCEINQRGIIIDKRFYPFVNLDSFWIDEDKYHPKVLIRSRKTLMSLIVMPLGDQDDDPIRNLLLDFLPEEELHEPFLQKLLERFGF